MVLFVSCCQKQIKAARMVVIMPKTLKNVYTYHFSDYICVVLPKASKGDKNIYDYYKNFANVYTTLMVLFVLCCPSQIRVPRMFIITTTTLPMYILLKQFYLCCVAKSK